MKKLIKRGINMAISKGIIKRVNTKPKLKSKSKINKFKPKTKSVKFSSIGKKQMRSGRYSTIKTSGGLLSKNLKISKKKLLES